MANPSYDDPGYMEAVYAALFTLLQTAKFAGNVSLNSFTRVFELPDDFVDIEQPALMLIPGPMSAEQREVFGPTKWTFTAVIVLLFRAEDVSPDSVGKLPAATANYLIWGIANVLGTGPSGYEKQTLGGLVHHCWLEGEVHAEVQEKQAMVTMPVHILAGPVSQ